MRNPAFAGVLADRLLALLREAEDADEVPPESAPPSHGEARKPARWPFSVGGARPAEHR